MVQFTKIHTRKQTWPCSQLNCDKCFFRIQNIVKEIRKAKKRGCFFNIEEYDSLNFYPLRSFARRWTTARLRRCFSLTAVMPMRSTGVNSRRRPCFTTWVPLIFSYSTQGLSGIGFGLRFWKWRSRQVPWRVWWNTDMFIMIRHWRMTVVLVTLLLLKNNQ